MIKKNLLGTLAAGGIRSANAHFANMLLGFYLATGQDAANIIEGSQGIVHAEVRNDDLYFSGSNAFRRTIFTCSMPISLSLSSNLYTKWIWSYPKQII